MIFDRFKEAELLDYVEDELDVTAARSLEARLAEAPEVLAAVARLRRDRSSLRSASDPAPPLDIVAELEPRIARAMLVETPPGSYRRRHRRRQRSAHRLRLAAAAVIGVVVIAGAWAGLSRYDWSGVLVADRDDDGWTAGPGENTPMELIAAAPPTGSAAGDASVWPPAGTQVHHYPPAVPARVATPEPAPVAPSRDPVMTTFALVLDGGSMDAVEETLLGAIESIPVDDAAGQSTALVRNFTQHEARAIVEAQLRAMSRGAASPDDLASISDRYRKPWQINDPGRRRANMANILREIRRSETDADEMPRSERLYGSAAAAPSFEAQLALSEAGASYCIAVRLEQLPALLERLHLDGGRTSLVEWPHAPETADGDWINDMRAVRAFAQMHHNAPGDRIVLLPVVMPGSERE
jgi:anti-sigma factor RsiW